MISRSLKRGLTIAEVLIASSLFLALMLGLMTTFRTALVQGPSRLGFEVSNETLDAHLEKVVDHLTHSSVHGVASTSWGSDGAILCIQRQAGIDSLGSVEWEERLQLYWKKNGESKLHHVDIGKDKAAAAGLTLDSRYPTKPDNAQLQALASAQEGKSKILQTSFTKFEVSEEWKTQPAALELRWGAENPEMKEQRYQIEAAVWLDSP